MLDAIIMYLCIGAAMSLVALIIDFWRRTFVPVNLLYAATNVFFWPFLLIAAWWDFFSALTFSVSITPFSWRLQVGGPWSGAEALWIVVGPIDIGVHWGG